MDEPDRDQVDQWLACMQAAYRRRDEECKTEFSRSLPFADALFDRNQRAQECGFGEGSSIYNSAFLFGDVQIGRATWVGPNVMLDGSGGGITIGDWCSISTGVHIYTHDTVMWALSGGKQAARHAAVSIGNRCYIGSQSIIVAGVTIGDCSVVAANSLVNKAIPANTIVGGTPAKRLGQVVMHDNDNPELVFDA